MNKIQLLAATTLVAVMSFSVRADSGYQPELMAENSSVPPRTAGNTMPMMGCQHRRMPMMRQQQGGMPMMGGPSGMRTPQMMQQMMAMRQQHMQTMEIRLANIEALLRQLVELQRK